MAIKPQSVRLRTPKKLATTTYVNEVASAVNGMGLDAPPPPPFQKSDAWVVGCIAPNTYKNEVYAVQVEYIVGGNGSQPATLPAEFKGDRSDGAGTILVTNVAETSPDFQPQSGSHLLRVGKRVLAWATVDEDGATTWLMNVNAAADTVVCQITTLATAAGEYTGKSLTGTCTADGTTDLTLPAGLTAAPVDDYLLLNPSESGASGHALEVGAFCVARVVSGKTAGGLGIALICSTSLGHGDAFQVYSTKADGVGTGWDWVRAH